LLTQVKEKEAARDSVDALQDLTIQSDEKRRKGKIQPFLDWLQINEIDTSKITIEPLGNMGLGVFTKAPIKSDEMVFVIPEKAMMTTANARNSKLSKKNRNCNETTIKKSNLTCNYVSTFICISYCRNIIGKGSCDALNAECFDVTVSLV